MPPSDPSLPAPGAHGGDGPAVARALGMDPDDLLDLSQNMNPVAPDIGPLVAVHLDSLVRYPDPAAATRLLAEALGADPGRVLLTNGGSEAIHLVAAVLGGGVLREPEFGLHPRSDRGPRWRTDPHSPSGRLATAEEKVQVWDEAFYPLATGRWTAGRDACLTVGSLTKTFHCPGLRLGYVVVPARGALTTADGRALDPDALLAGLRTAQPHWSVSTLALAVLPDLLATADLPGWARAIAALRDQVVHLLEDAGLRVEAAQAPWVLVHEPALRERLAPHGVLVRDCTSFGMPGTARIAVPGPGGLERVERALRAASGG
ncbi:hypothetical protein BJF81_15335 [Ornithinimicrobium sp. CNJ-824]|uniref:aminotransferase class I/II-fold pyridoxal phosphate-dependent enzyme n=1 Tax=Ornithinimicrobium sp. CNJ-824 TaxID=1904966 RepID=UPI00095A0301|nr:aminotransferase class I/II-fold pyridoxal phosphate-dependent enzyme [Ornithinimicrobium sp. CNJ-824]OLT21309.1 hypothetical protein BJF81_15335 [Ornithinimicrobium sp. CNJ-824]